MNGLKIFSSVREQSFVQRNVNEWVEDFQLGTGTACYNGVFSNDLRDASSLGF